MNIEKRFNEKIKEEVEKTLQKAKIENDKDDFHWFCGYKSGLNDARQIFKRLNEVKELDEKTMNKEDLKQIREANYKKWFDRFVAKNDLDNKIKIANSKGYTGYQILIDKNDEREKFMKNNDSFIKLLKERYPNFNVYRDQIIKPLFIGTDITQTVVINWKWQNVKFVAFGPIHKNII